MHGISDKLPIIFIVIAYNRQYLFLWAASQIVLPSKAINCARNFFIEFLASREEWGARNARNFMYIEMTGTVSPEMIF